MGGSLVCHFIQVYLQLFQMHHLFLLRMPRVSLEKDWTNSTRETTRSNKWLVHLLKSYTLSHWWIARLTMEWNSAPSMYHASESQFNIFYRLSFGPYRQLIKSKFCVYMTDWDNTFWNWCIIEHMRCCWQQWNGCNVILAGIAPRQCMSTTEFLPHCSCVICVWQPC